MPLSRQSKTTYIVLGIVALVPVLGFIQAIILLILCALNGVRKGFVIIAVIGAISSFGTWAFLKYQATHRGMFDEVRILSAKSSMRTMLMDIEYYKATHAGYPNNIDSFFFFSRRSVLDPTQEVSRKATSKNFTYILLDSSHYTLFSRGFDGIAFTEDDILPSFDQLDMKFLGWIPPDSTMADTFR